MRQDTIERADRAASVRRQIPGSAVTSWVLYDLANTIFSMGVVSLYLPLWISGQVGEERADSVYTAITAISMGAIFFASPLLGAMTDRARRRMPFLVVSTTICVLCTAMLARSGLRVTAVFFIIANIAYQAGLQFYDALLPEVSTPENRGWIGGIGVGVGYVGSFLAVAAGFLVPADRRPLLFTIIAGLFLLFAVPCFLFVRERGNARPRPINLKMVGESTRETIAALRNSQRYPGLLRFLIGRVFYTDAINTVILVMTLFVVNVAAANGIADQPARETQARIIMMFAITFAVIGGFVWGIVTDRIGPKRTLDRVLRAWIGIFIATFAIGVFQLPLWTVYLLGASAGLCLGGVWAADRPLMLRLTPPARIGEFYGLYGMVGRFAAVIGPLIWGLTFHIAVERVGLQPLRGQGIAVLALLVLVLLGYRILRPISDELREWQGADLSPINVEPGGEGTLPRGITGGGND